LGGFTSARQPAPGPNKLESEPKDPERYYDANAQFARQTGERRGGERSRSHQA